MNYLEMLGLKSAVSLAHCCVNPSHTELYDMLYNLDKALEEIELEELSVDNLSLEVRDVLDEMSKYEDGEDHFVAFLQLYRAWREL